ncbi:MAG TPA: hypothetical protein VMW63_06035 [Methanoregulaceae archaeon]|nr:hypothetical protein [Methanoregulaceae archaeon]
MDGDKFISSATGFASCQTWKNPGSHLKYHIFLKTFEHQYFGLTEREASMVVSIYWNAAMKQKIWISIRLRPGITGLECGLHISGEPGFIQRSNSVTSDAETITEFIWINSGNGFLSCMVSVPGIPKKVWRTS